MRPLGPAADAVGQLFGRAQAAVGADRQELWRAWRGPSKINKIFEPNTCSALVAASLGPARLGWLSISWANLLLAAPLSSCCHLRADNRSANGRGQQVFARPPKIAGGQLDVANLDGSTRAPASRQRAAGCKAAPRHLLLAAAVAADQTVSGRPPSR